MRTVHGYLSSDTLKADNDVIIIARVEIILLEIID